MIRAVTGLNEARDGTIANSDALVGVQKLAALKFKYSNKTYILMEVLYIYRTLSEALTYRIADILEYSDFKDDFM